MLTAHPVAAVREAEGALLRQEAPPDGPPSGTASGLMDKAAVGLAAVAMRALRADRGAIRGAEVVVLAGKGDNGGDALLAGARLAARGARVTAVVGEAAHREGMETLVRAGGRWVGVEAATDDLLGEADLLLDGILGIGADGGLREPWSGLVGRVEQVSRRPLVVAVDLPSGIGPDDGQVKGPVLAADVTVTFGALKPGLLLPPAADYCGRIELVDIGLDLSGEPAVWRLEASDVADLWPRPGAVSQKYSRGVLGSVAGSATYTGAALLSSRAAVRAGVGMLRFNGSDEAQRHLRQAVPEAVHGDGRVQAWVLGSGVDPQDGVLTSRIADALRSGLPCVVDAGALEVVPTVIAEASGEHPWLLTPHAGEAATVLSRLTDAEVARAEVEAEPARWVRRLAELTGAAVLLKGATTLVCGPDGPLFAQADGTAWMATAGSGDVLAGVAGALLSGLGAAAEADGASLDTRQVVVAGAAAALVHGFAGRAAAGVQEGVVGHPIVAGDIATALPNVLTF